MAKKNLIRSNSLPYHITGRGNNREHFPTSLDYTWKVFVNNLNFVRDEYSVRIHAFVMMPNHFHLVLSTPAQDLGIVMRDFMRSTTKTMNAASGRSGRVFGGSYHGSLVEDLYHYDHVLKYVYRNPVKANLVPNAEDYLYSSLRPLMDLQPFHFPMEPLLGTHSLIPYNSKTEYLEWLNRPSKTEQDEAIKKGLMRSTFRVPKAKSTPYFFETLWK